MARDLAPKFKRARREGVDLHPDLDKAGTAKSPLIRKGYQPGVHGPKSFRTKVTNYGTQLREKQKAKRMYGILEKQFHNYYKKAIRTPGDTGESMLKLLENRLDNIVYRLGFAKTRPAARQMVNHGHVLVNGKRGTIPSMQIQGGSEIKVKENISKQPSYQEMLTSLDRSTPSWLSRKETTGTVVTDPDIEEPKTLIDVRRIVEFYSK